MTAANEKPDLILRRTFSVVGGLLLVRALLVLGGMKSKTVLLVRIVPDLPPMGITTALSILLTGLAFLALAWDRRTVLRWLAGGLMALGTGTILFYAVAGVLGLSRYAYDPDWVPPDTAVYGQTSPATAFAMAVSGLSFLLMTLEVMRIRSLVACASILVSLGFLSACGWFTGLHDANTWWHYSGVGESTAAGVAAVGVGTLLWVARRAPPEKRQLALSLPFFSIGLGTITVVTAVALVAVGAQLARQERVVHTVVVQADIERFLSALSRSEAAVRVYALTGDRDRLDRYAVYRAAAARELDTLGEAVTDDPGQTARVRTVRTLLTQRTAFNERVARARETGGAEAASRIALTEDMTATDALRTVLDQLRVEEGRLLTEAESHAALIETTTHRILVIGLALTGGLLATALIIVLRTQRSLQTANTSLEENVRRRTADLQLANAQLLERERNLQFLADTMPQLAWTTRMDDRLVETFNRRWVEYTGLTEAESRHNGWARVVHPDDLKPTLAEWSEMKRHGRPGGGEHRLRRAADGEMRWHLWRAQPQRDPSGRVILWVGTSTDIHEQKIAGQQLERRIAERTAALHDSEESFRSAFDDAGIGMAIIGLDGRWTRVNPAICDLVGYPRDELMRKTFQDITHPEDLEADLAQVQELLAGVRRSYQMEKRYFHRDGRIIWIRLTASLVRDGMGAPSHFISQIEDITERKHLESDLRRARDQALEASRLKSEFLATMSHEIRTPMNGILGMTGLLLDSPLDQESLDMCRVIQSAAESLLSIINDILDLSRIEAGKLRIEPVAFDLERVVRETVTLLASRAAQKSLALECVFPSEFTGELEGDAGRIRQVLTNLMGNAIKFTERGHVTVRVAIIRQDAAAVTARISVQDTGIGIPPEAHGRLFQPFTQVDGSATRRFGGTGLGLAICRQLVTLMGGEIGYRTEVGRGSEFWFELTLPRATASTQSAGDKPASAGEPELRPLRILLVEDNPANQIVARQLLGRMGHTIDTAFNGEDGLAQLGREDYDVVLMDCQMPVLDGYEATRRIRSGTVPGVDPRTPVIALTAYAMAEDREECLAAGMDDYVSKPISAYELRAALARRGLGRGETDTASPAATGTATADTSAVGNSEPATTAATATVAAPRVTIDTETEVLNLRTVQMVRSLPGTTGVSLWPEMTALFEREEPRWMAGLEAVVKQRGDRVVLMQTAHLLAGSCASLGATQMRATALALEKAAATEEWSALEVRFAALRNASGRLREALKEA